MQKRETVYLFPHTSLKIPKEIKYKTDEFSLDCANEYMCDMYVDKLFDGVDSEHCVKAEVSRLAVDVERFEDDFKEVMAAAGMGVIYTRDFLGRLIRDPSDMGVTREYLIDTYYRPYHERVHRLTEKYLANADEVLLVDCHSFSRDILYTSYYPDQFPDICIGTDNYHTPMKLLADIVTIFERSGYNTKLNVPFRGCYIPEAYYEKDKRFQGIMIEINKRVYLENNEMHEGAERLKNTIKAVMEYLEEN